jgi:hypothetical protein
VKKDMCSNWCDAGGDIAPFDQNTRNSQTPSEPS